MRLFNLECAADCRWKHRMVHKFWRPADPACVQSCLRQKYKTMQRSKDAAMIAKCTNKNSE